MEGESGTWAALPSELIQRIASFLSLNEVSCTLRLINKDTANALRTWIVVRLSKPAPCHAFRQRWRSLHGQTLEQRKQFIYLVARSGVITNLEVAIVAAGCPVTQELYKAAAEEGHVHVFEWLQQRGIHPRRPEVTNRMADLAASFGHSSVVRWLLQQCESEGEPRVHRQLIDISLAAAAAAGHWALCEALLANVSEGWARTIIYPAAQGGHVELTERLLARLAQQQEQQQPQTTEAVASEAGGASGATAGVDDAKLLASAAYGFDLPSLQRLYEGRVHNLRCSSSSNSNPYAGSSDSTRHIESAGVNANLGAQLLFSALVGRTPDWRTKVEWLETVLGCCLDGGSFKTYWIRYNNCSGNWPCASHFATQRFCVERLAFLRHRPGMQPFAPPFPDLILYAIRKNNLQLFRYLRAEGFLTAPNRWDKLVEVAVQSGANVEILAELLAAGWPMGRDDVLMAARQGRLEVLQLLALPEAGPAAEAALRQAVEGTRLLEAAARSGSLGLVQWLREAGCAWNAHAFNAAAAAGNAALLEWMAAEGCTMWHTGQPYVEAGHNDDFATLQCLRRLGCPWDPKGATFNGALSRGCSLNVLKWMLAEGCPVDMQSVRRIGSNRVMALLQEQAAAAEAAAATEGEPSASGAMAPATASEAEAVAAAAATAADAEAVAAAAAEASEAEPVAAAAAKASEVEEVAAAAATPSEAETGAAAAATASEAETGAAAAATASEAEAMATAAATASEAEAMATAAATASEAETRAAAAATASEAEAMATAAATAAKADAVGSAAAAASEASFAMGVTAALAGETSVPALGSAGSSRAYGDQVVCSERSVTEARSGSPKAGQVGRRSE